MLEKIATFVIAYFIGPLVFLIVFCVAMSIIGWIFGLITKALGLAKKGEEQ